MSRLFADDLRPTRILKDLELYLNTKINPQEDLLILDEIQAIPKALTSLKFFNLELPQLAICSAGSLLGIELSQDSFPVGYVEFLKLYPLSFKEFLSAIGATRCLEALSITQGTSTIEHDQLWHYLKIYFITGGLPEIVQTYLDQQNDNYLALHLVREKQKQLITAYLADIAKHSGQQNAMHIERVWHSIPEQLARAQNGSASKFQFKGVIPGQSRYSRMAGAIDWLTKSGLVIKSKIANKGLLPFAAYSNENQFKLYLFDVGLLGALSQLTPQNILNYDYGSYKGYFAENYVAQELYSGGQTELYGWQEGTSEIEFLLEKQGQVIPLEVKSGNTMQAKSLSVFNKKYTPPYRIILSARRWQISDDSALRRYPLYLAGELGII